MSYRLKTILGVALIEAILLAVMVWNSIEILTNSVEDGLTKRAVTTTRLFADAAKDAVISSDLATLDSLVDKLTKNPDLTYVRVLGPNNVVLAKASAQPHSIPSSFKADSSYRSTDDGVYDAFTEITEAGKILGRVEIGFSIAPLTATVESAQRNSTSLAIAEIIIVALFSFGLGLYLTRRLRQLTKASRQIAKGEFEYQLEVHGKDELAETEAAFNTMSQQLSSLYDQVAEDRNRLRTIIDASLDAIIEIDRHGRIVEFNPAAETIFGYSREAAIGTSLTETIIPKHLRDVHLNRVENWLKTGKGAS
jgi:two-component system sensor histidine kinase/response regulator